MGGAVMRVTPEGAAFVYCTGFRTPNGMGMSPDGRPLVGDNQGNWIPASKVSLTKRRGFYGVFPAVNNGGAGKQARDGFDPPAIWMPQKLDSSCGGQLWVEDERFGPLSGRYLHTSFGKGWMYGLVIEDGEVKGMVRNPATLEHAAIFCSECHSDVIKRIGRSMMNTESGILNVLKYQWGEQSDLNGTQGVADLRRDLPVSYTSPTMSPKCSDEEKYGVVDSIVATYTKAMEAGETVAGRKIAELITVNGVRFILEDGSWGLVRASSNTPNLVIVVESMASPEDMKAIFADIQARLSAHPSIGAFDQTL